METFVLFALALAIVNMIYVAMLSANVNKYNDIIITDHKILIDLLERVTEGEIKLRSQDEMAQEIEGLRKQILGSKLH